MGKISYLKRIFLEPPDETLGDFFPAGPFFPELKVNIYRSALIKRKLSRPKKFLVTRL